MIDAATLRAREADLLTRTMILMTEGMECKHWCYAVQGFATVKLVDGAFRVKLPGVRKPSVMAMVDAVDAIVTAHQGPVGGAA